MSFRLVSKSVTLNDLEWRNGRFCVIPETSACLVLDIQQRIIFWSIVWCGRKKSSRSLSYLL